MRGDNPYAMHVNAAQQITFVPHAVELFGARVLVVVADGATKINLNVSSSSARLLAAYLQIAANHADQLAEKAQAEKGAA